MPFYWFRFIEPTSIYTFVRTYNAIVSNAILNLIVLKIWGEIVHWFHYGTQFFLCLCQRIKFNSIIMFRFNRICIIGFQQFGCFFFSFFLCGWNSTTNIYVNVYIIWYCRITKNYGSTSKLLEYIAHKKSVTL